MRPILGRALALLAPALLVLTTLPAFADEGTRLPQNKLAKDLEQLAGWLEGRFDNDLQIREEASEAGSEEGPVRLHSLFVPQDFEELGEHVFYVQQTLDDKPRKVHRQRFYHFEADPDQKAIRLKVLVPNDPSALFDLHKEPQKRTGLSPDDLGHDPSCDPILTRKKRGKKGDHFAGAVPSGACQEESSRYGKTLVITKEVYLDQDEFWILEQARDTEGTLIYGPANGEPQKLRKANTYRCQTFSQDGEDLKEGRSFEVHDQGNRLRIDPNRSGRLTLHLYREPAETKRDQETVHLVLEERGRETALGSAQAEAGAETLNLETPKLKVTCQRQDDWIRQGVGDP